MFVKETWPSSFSLFLDEALRLSLLHLPRKVMAEPVEVANGCQFGMSPKKFHEVRHLVAAIDALCRRSGCKFIVDIGSGLVSFRCYALLSFCCCVSRIQSLDDLPRICTFNLHRSTNFLGQGSQCTLFLVHSKAEVKIMKQYFFN